MNVMWMPGLVFVFVRFNADNTTLFVMLHAVFSNYSVACNNARHPCGKGFLPKKDRLKLLLMGNDRSS